MSDQFIKLFKCLFVITCLIVVTPVIADSANVRPDSTHVKPMQSAQGKVYRCFYKSSGVLVSPNMNNTYNMNNDDGWWECGGGKKKNVAYQCPANTVAVQFSTWHYTNTKYSKRCYIKCAPLKTTLPQLQCIWQNPSDPPPA